MTSLGKDWHRPCLRCERCSKTLTPGGHAEVREPLWGPRSMGTPCQAVPKRAGLCHHERAERLHASRAACPHG